MQERTGGDGSGRGHRILESLMRWRVLWVAGAFVLRAVAGLLPSHQFDRETYQAWGRALRERPIADFYATVDKADHLPGDLWLHTGLARLVDPDAAVYPMLLALIPVVADLVIAAMIVVLVGRLRSPRAGWVTAIAYLWCPPPVMVGVSWGQWDQVSIAAVLAGVTLAVCRPRWVLAGVALAAWGVVMKPQLALTACAVAAAPLWGASSIWRVVGWRRLGALVAGAGVTGVLTVEALCRPFGVGLLPGARWSLMERMAAAADLYQAVSLGAPNIWTVLMPGWRMDDETLMGLPARLAGHVFLLALLLIAVLVVWRMPAPRSPAVYAGLAAIALNGFYLLQTRNHERYFMPGLVAAIIWAGLSRLSWRRIVPVAILSVGYAVTIASSLWGPVEWLGATYRLLSVVHLSMFAVLFALILSPRAVLAERCG